MFKVTGETKDERAARKLAAKKKKRLKKWRPQGGGVMAIHKKIEKAQRKSELALLESVVQQVQSKSLG